MAKNSLALADLMGPIGDQYVTANSIGEAHALNAQGYQLVPSASFDAGDGKGTFLLRRSGYTPGGVSQSLLSRGIEDYNAGRAANEQRYADILAGYQQREADANAVLDTLGGRTKRDLNERFDRASAAAVQGAISRGLGDSSVAFNMQRGVEADRARALLDADESLRRQALDYRMSLAGDRLAFMERRNDQYPTLDQLGQLALFGANAAGGVPGVPQTVTANHSTVAPATSGGNPQVKSIVPGITF